MAMSHADRKRKANAVEGPDWYDVSEYISQIEQMHGVTLSIRMTHAFERLTCIMRVEVRGNAPVLVGDGQVYQFDGVEHFPHHEHKTLEGLVYRLLWDLDLDAAKLLWKQRELDFSA